MTEEEAKTKWCPHSFGAMPANNEYGAPLRDVGPYVCCGSACMAWRWSYRKGDLINVEIVRDMHGEKQTLKIAEGGAGYCGLVGKP